MCFEDVPSDADVIFVGGSTEWKRQAIVPWCQRFPRVHVGRINTDKWLRYCEAAGAESVDGTGWFRGRLMGNGVDTGQAKELTEWLAETSGEKPRRPSQQSLSFANSSAETAPGSECCETAALSPAGERK